MVAFQSRLRTRLETYRAAIPLGMASIVLGVLGLSFVFLPILGIPISGLGLLLGVIGALTGWFVGGPLSLRWSAGGLAIGAVSMALNVAVAYAPAGYIPRRPPPEPWEVIPSRREIPAPAAFEMDAPTPPPAIRQLPTRPAPGATPALPPAPRTHLPEPVTPLTVPQSLPPVNTRPGSPAKGKKAQPALPPTIVLPPIAPTPTAPPTIPIPGPSKKK